MSRREQFEQLVESYADYEGPRSHDLKFLIELVCDLQIALDEITLCDSLLRAQEIASKTLEREAKHADNDSFDRFSIGADCGTGGQG